MDVDGLASERADQTGKTIRSKTHKKVPTRRGM